jgi:hypothetical protein
MRGAFAFDADPGGWLAAVSAGALYFLGAILIILNHHSAYLFTPLHLPGAWGLPIGLLMVGGLAGLHARHTGYPGYGPLGTTGFLLAVGGLLVVALLETLLSSAVPGGAFPFAAAVVATGMASIVAGVGMLLLWVATLRAAVLPQPWRTLPLVFFLLDIPFTTLAGGLFETVGVTALLYAQPLLLGLGWGLLGYALLSGIGVGAQRRGASAR